VVIVAAVNPRHRMDRFPFPPYSIWTDTGQDINEHSGMIIQIYQFFFVPYQSRRSLTPHAGGAMITTFPQLLFGGLYYANHVSLIWGRWEDGITHFPTDS
jgi:hypothetical protein